MQDINNYLLNNKDEVTDWMFDFFGGKYTRDDIVKYAWTVGTEEETGSNRYGVVELANEFNNIEEKNTDTIRQWYIDTDFYVFDLISWNSSLMFREKAMQIISMIKENNYKSVVDFGGGLGVLSIMIRQLTDCKVYYVDLKGGSTYNFAKFMMDKLNITDVTMLGDQEFFESNIQVDCIIAADCFEHIPNMQETFENLTQHAYRIYHDSTFYSDKIFPQHVYTPRMLDFINMCAIYNYLPYNGDTRLLHRVYLQFTEDGHLHVVRA